MSKKAGVRRSPERLGNFVTILTAAVALVFSLVASRAASAAPASSGQSIGAAPAPDATQLSAGHNYFAPTVAPGSAYSASVVLANANSNAVSVYLYGVDGLTSPGSGTAFSNRGQAITGAGTWIHAAHPSLTLGADSRTTVSFSVEVPAGTAPGDHLGGIAIEGASPSQSAQKGAVKVNIVTRSVIGVLVRVPGHAVFALRLGAPTLTFGTYHIGQVSTPITDIGGLIGNPQISVTLHGPVGYKKTITRRLDTILPGDKTVYSIYWPDSLRGHYTIVSCAAGAGLARQVCSSGQGTIAASTPTQKHNGGAFTGGGKTSTSSGGVPIVLVGIVGGIAAVLLLGGGTMLGVRRTKRRLLAQIAAAQAATPGAEPALQSATAADDQPGGTAE